MSLKNRTINSHGWEWHCPSFFLSETVIVLCVSKLFNSSGYGVTEHLQMSVSKKVGTNDSMCTITEWKYGLYLKKLPVRLDLRSSNNLRYKQESQVFVFLCNISLTVTQIIKMLNHQRSVTAEGFPPIGESKFCMYIHLQRVLILPVSTDLQSFLFSLRFVKSSG